MDFTEQTKKAQKNIEHVANQIHNLCKLNMLSEHQTYLLLRAIVRDYEMLDKSCDCENCEKLEKVLEVMLSDRPGENIWN